MIPPRRTFRPITPQAPKPFLYPRGTILADIPALARGLTEMEYLDYCIAVSKKAPIPEPIAPAAETPAFGSQRRLRR